MNLPVRNIESHGINCIFMSFKCMEKFSGLCFPDFTGSIVAACYKPKIDQNYTYHRSC